MERLNKTATSLLLLLALSAGQPAQAAPQTAARALLDSGKYAAAEKALRKLGGAGALDLARLQLETGRYAAAVKTARGAARGKQRGAAQTLQGEAQRAAGDLPAAEATLKALVAKHPTALRARMLLGRVYASRGKAALAKAIFDQFYDEYGADKIDKKSSEALTYVAIACRQTDNFRDAHDTLRDALKLDDKYVEAWLELGEISLEKYEAGHAEQHFLKVLAINPHNVRALLGLARVKQVQTNRDKPIFELLAKVRAVDPKNVTAEAIEAGIELDNDGYAATEKRLQRALKRNPRHLEALSVLAASHFLRDDLAGYAKLKKRVLSLNPRYTRFFRRVMHHAVRKHRYAEAVKLGKEAIKLDPQDWYVQADVGINYLRMADEKQGLKHLKAAWQGDQFNVRTYNMLNLWDDILDKTYAFAKSKHFRLRAHKSEIKLLARTLLPLMEEGFRLYQRKYGYTPKLPITLEIYKNPSHFAIRTFGLPPDPGAIGGVCFGRLITSMSPSLRRFNWGQVLWHELNHVFTVSMSRHRVPRWLTEGLAVMEPMQRRSEWRRENDFDIYKAIKGKRLAGLAEMNSVFTRRGLRDVLIGYYQGGLLADFFARTSGLPKVRRILREYARGKRTEQILPAVLGKPLDVLDREFRADQLKRLAYYDKSWYLDGEHYDKLEPFVAAAKAKPNDVKVLAELAAAQLYHRKTKEAAATAQKVATMAPTHKIGLFVRATLAEKGGKQGDAEKLWQELIAAGGDGYHARISLGRLALRRKALAEAEQHLALAKRFDPERQTPYRLLAAAYEAQKKTALMIDELKGIVQLNQQSYRSAFKLTGLLAAKNAWADVRKYAQMAYYIYPGSAELHRMLASAWENPAPRPDVKRAIWHLETALLCQPKDPKEVHRKLAELYRRLGQRAKAAEHAQQAK